jgi:hypothetical protein
MTTQATEGERLGPPNYRIEQFRAVTLVAGNAVFGAIEGQMLADPWAQEIEVPRGSVVLEHLMATADGGRILYLTRHGDPLAAVVPVHVARAFEEEQIHNEDRRPNGGVQEIADDYEARLGPVPPEVQTEVDRQWAAAASL